MKHEPRPDDFDEDWRARRIVPALGARWTFHGHPPTDLETLVATRARRLVHSLSSGNRVVLGVAVERGDGMSWSAKAAHRAAGKAVGRDWRVISLGAGQQTAFQELADLVGPEAVEEAVRESGLEPDLQRHWGWWSGLAALVIGLGAAAAVAKQSADAPGLALLATIALVIVVAGVPLVQRIAGAQIIPLFGPAARRRATDALSREPKEAAVELKFRQLMHGHLLSKQRRVVVVDDLGECDPRVRELVLGFLRNPGPGLAEELWVLFERGQRPGKAARRRSGDALNAPHLSGLKVAATVTLWNARQQPFTSEEKEALIQRRTHQPVRRDDPRRRLRVVRDIVDSRRADEQVTVAELQDLLAGADDVRRRTFALLALAAAAPDPAPIAASDLAEIMREGSTASPPPVAKLLAAWMPEHARTPVAIGEAVKDVSRTLRPLLEDGDERIAVVPVFADALRRRELWDDSTLGTPDAGHAFWALYWHRRLQSHRTAAVVERLSTHLRALQSPLRVRKWSSKATAAALASAATDAVHASLALCVAGVTADGRDPEDRGLLEQARLLVIGEQNNPDPKAVDALLAAAWSAYGLCGEPAILATIRELGHETRPARADSAAADELVDLYVESLPRGSGERLRFPSLRDPRAAAVLDHGRLRAALLAEVHRPLRSHYHSSLFENAAAASHRDLSTITGRVAQRLSETPSALDALSLDLAMLCGLLQRAHGHDDGGAFAARVATLDPLATKQLRAQANAAAPQDFLLRGLLVQLDLACEVWGLLGSAKPERLDSAMTELEGVHVLWHNLETYELADLTALLRNAVSVLSGRPAPRESDDDTLADYLLGIGTTEAEALHQVLADLLVGGERLATSRATASVPLLQGAKRAIGARLGPTFTFDLSRAVLALSAHTLHRELDDIIEYISDPEREREGKRLIADGDPVPQARMLLSAASDPGSPVGKKIRAALTEERRRIDDPLVAERLDRELDLDWITRHPGEVDLDAVDALLERWHTRVWGPGAAPDENDASEPHTAYAVVLTSVLDRVPQRRDAVLPLAVRLLRESLDATPDYADVQLARWVVKTADGSTPLDDDALETAIEVLREGAVASARLGTPEAMAWTYDLLAQHDPEHASAHREEAAKWRRLGPQLEEERFEHYIQAAQLFEVFWYYAARYPSLRVPGPGDASDIPEPLVYDNDGKPVGVVSEFLDLGFRALHMPSSNGHGEDVRASIEAAAREHLLGFFTLVVEHAEVSDDVREMVQRHRRRFHELKA